MRQLANQITVEIQAIHSDALFAPLIQCAAPGHSSISNTSNARSQDEPTAASAALRAMREAAICQGEPMIPILYTHQSPVRSKIVIISVFTNIFNVS